MESLLFRHAAEDPDLAEWLVLGAKTHHAVLWEKGPLEDLAAQAQRRRVIGLIPSEQVLLTRVAIPNRNKKQLRRAAPYALEEELAEDVEELHFAFGTQAKDGPTGVAIIRHEAFSQWLDAVKATGMSLQCVLPDVLALPREAGAWSILIEAGRCLVRTGEERGFACEPELLPALLQGALEEAADTPPEFITRYNCTSATPDLRALNLEIREGDCQQGPITLFAKGLAEDPELNLLQGAFEAKAEYSAALKPWRAAAVLAACWLALAFGARALEVHQLSTQKAQLNAAIEKTYREAFPNAKRIVNPRVQMEQKLKALRGAEGANEGGFLTLLAGAAEAIGQSKDVSVEAVNFRGGRLDFDLTAAGPSDLDQLKQRIEKQTGVKAELQSVSASGKRVTGRLRLEGAS